MTGGMRGWCAPRGVARPAGFGAGFARGGGMGRGGGRGNRWMYYATGLPGWMRFGGGAGVPAPMAGPAVAPADEVSALRAQADWMQRQLEAIQARMAELERPE